MNNLEAKLILQAYRPNGKDASDPFFREALEQVERDPALKKWFTNEMAWETNISSQLERAAPIPHGLKANLLALQTLERRAPWWLIWVRLSAATAAVTLAVVAGFLLMRPQGKALESFQETMTLFSLQHMDHVTYEPRDLSKIEQWLHGNGMTTNFDLPSELQAVGAQGCRVIDWNKQKVTMICFVSKVKGEHFDLFIMDNPGNSILHTGATPRYASRNGLATAYWSKDGEFFLLAGENREAVRNIIQSI